MRRRPAMDGIADCNKLRDSSSDYLFKFLVLAQVFMYLEAGAVPSLLQEFTRTFSLSPQDQGLLGAVIYISISLASPWCSTLFRRFYPRELLGVSLVVNKLAVLGLACAPTSAWYSKILLISVRGCVGLTQAFICVYSPLWVHDYAPKSKRGTWMSYLQGASPFGYPQKTRNDNFISPSVLSTLYLETNTKDSMNEIHVAYLLISGTGPIMGVFFGGWLIDQFGGYSGAYHQMQALRVCMVLGGSGCLAALPVSYVHNTFYIAVFLWLMLFCGGSILPACSGIVISAVPSRLRPLASSVAYASYNLFGYAASNYVPGLIMNFIIDPRPDFTDRSGLERGKSCNAACTYRI
ncbi:hypothetical protein PsorP6_011936 [Peronosclerospora sorghi]|uniref:Uncharacterized protein n=1 Tax=Peronosclerospora sorghi TaxID=230839 RepID=A0ACC0WJ25_9STRA|nr:hypothetical protein PsorP6_011936 [Peronosclerospora sorghi]